MSWGDVRTVENWREDALPGHTHDPHEVTIQLDGAGRLLGEMIAAGKRPGEEIPIPGREPGVDKEVPVFVDDSGRRGRTFRRVGVALGLACAVYAIVIVVTLFSGSSSAPALPDLADEDQKSAEQVDTTPQAPTGSASPAAPAGSTPGPSASGTAADASGAPGDAASSSADASTEGQGVPGTGATGSGNPTGRASTKPADPESPAGGASTPAAPSTPAGQPSATAPTDDPPADGDPGGTDAVSYRTATRTPVPLQGAEPAGSSLAS